MFSSDLIDKITKYSAIVMSMTEVLKLKLKLKDALAVVLSVLVSAVVCLPELSTGVLNYIIIALGSSLGSNGFWKILNKLAKKSSS